ncbi:MAG TPA: transposase, partial [Leptospiraceae bacterium]|nr:transposase [Leptospiraceae bacterium]
MEKIRFLIRDELYKAFPPDFKLPPEGEDVTASIQNKPVVAMDTIALYSCSNRANQGRKRHKNRGATSSIYMSEKLGGRQIGTLAQVMGTQSGWCVAHSVPDQKAGTLGPLIRQWIPHNAAVFSDEMYTWLWGIYKNHRMVNHSLKSKDSRYRFSRERWSRKGVCSATAEALNNSLKTAFRNYTYVRPQYSQMYLDEWCWWKNVKYFGLEKVKECGESMGSMSPKVSHSSRLQSAIKRQLYQLPDPLVVRNSNRIKVNGKLDPVLQRLLDTGDYAALADAITSNDHFWSNPNKVHERVKE